MAPALSPAAPLRVGVEADLEPISFIDSRGVPTGFVIDLIDAIAREAQLDVVYVVRPRPEMFADFDAGRTEALANIVHVQEREGTMAFAVTHLELASTIFVRRGAGAIRTADDLRNVRIAGLANSRGHEYLRAHGYAEHFMPVPTMREGLHAVADGRADATIITRLFGRVITRDDHLGNLTESDVELPELTYRFHVVLHPGDTARLAAVDEGLARIRANGVYDSIYERWVGPLEPRPLRWKDLQPYVWPSLLLAATGLVVLVWQRRVLARLARQAAALHHSEERLTLVLEGGDHGLWDWNVTSGHIERNERIPALLGYTPDEILPSFESWTRLMHPDDGPGVAAMYQRLLKSTENAFVLEYRMRTKDGRWRWIYTRGKVLERGPDGIARRAVGTHTDITERKLAEEERATLQRKVLEAQKLESVGLLAGGIAHDFNNILTIILGQATLARQPGTGETLTQEALGQIESAARRAADLCQQMLAYAGGGRFAPQPLDLNALLTDLASLLRHSVTKDAKLVFALAETLPPIEADPTQLRQIVMNLVINASEAFGAGGGTIRLATAVRAPDETELREAVHVPDPPAASGRYVCLTVADTGCGMTPETRAKIFEPFFTTKFTGRGLGLAAVLGIVRAHRGVFGVRSAPDAGSTFTLFFPALAGVGPVRSGPTPVGPAPVVAAAAAGKILLADDEPTVLAMVAPILRRQGYEIVTAVDGREAVEKFRAAPQAFAGVVLDLTMPGFDGAAALAEMRAARPEIPAVLMSGFGVADVLTRFPADRRPVFLQKPFTHLDLVARVAEALGPAVRVPPAPAPPEARR